MRPEVATRIINLLNSNCKEVLKSKCVKYRTTTVMDAENIFMKIIFIQQAQNKCIMVKRNIESFTNKFENLVKMGFPLAWDDKGKLISFENYKNKFFIITESEENFKGMVDILREKTIVDLLIDDLYLLWKIKKTIIDPSYI
jgi:Mg2+/Co2+ transporter CorC